MKRVTILLSIIMAASTPSPAAAITDPCGGPKELLNKLNPSPCVVVAGEAMLAFGYANITTNGHVQLTGPFQPGVDLPISGNANAAPNMLFAFGVSPRAQLQVTLPTNVSVTTMRLGTTSATTDAAIDYKQLVYVNEKDGAMGGFDVGYVAPTGTSSSPAYRAELLFTRPLSETTSAGAYWTFNNTAVTTNSGTTERAWSDPIGVYLSWSAPNGGFAVSPLLSHSFNPNRTALIIELDQFVNRHFLVDVQYGGLALSAAGNGGLGQTFNFNASANPRAFVATLYFLIGESELPPAPK